MLAFTQCRLLCTRKAPYMYPVRKLLCSGGPTLTLSGLRGQAPVKATTYPLFATVFLMYSPSPPHSLPPTQQNSNRILKRDA